MNKIKIEPPSGLDLLELGLALAVAVGAAVASRWIEEPMLVYLPLAVALATTFSSHKRHLRDGQSDLPLVAAVGLAFVILFVCLFNEADEILWGFGHFSKQPSWAARLALCLLPLLWHSYSLRLAKELTFSFLAQRRFPWAVFYVLAALLFWSLRSYFVTRDGFIWIGVTRSDCGLNSVLMREPLVYVVLRAVRLIMSPLGFDSRDAVAAVSVLSGLASLCALRRLWRLWELSVGQAALAWAATAVTFGLTQMWFGHVEVYPPFCAAVVWVFYLASKALRRGQSLWPVAVAYALAFGFHLSAAWMGPALVVLICLGARGKGVRGLLRSVSQVAFPFALVHLVFWSAIVAFEFHFEVADFIVQAVQIPTAARGTPAFYRLAEMDRVFWLDHFQMIFVLCGAPLALLGLCLLAAVRLPRTSRTDTTATLQPSPDLWVFLAGLAGYGVFSVFWRPERPWWEDWDVFSALAPMALITALRLILARERGAAFTAAAQVVFGLFLVLSAMNVFYFHTHPTALSQEGFLYVPPRRQEGHLLQKYYVDYPRDPMKTPVVRNGELIVLTNE